MPTDWQHTRHLLEAQEGSSFWRRGLREETLRALTDTYGAGAAVVTYARNLPIRGSLYVARFWLFSGARVLDVGREFPSLREHGHAPVGFNPAGELIVLRNEDGRVFYLDFAFEQDADLSSHVWLVAPSIPEFVPRVVDETVADGSPNCSE